jgi:hypothetical protein
MKAFEEWWDKPLTGIEARAEEILSSVSSEERASVLARHTWRAALEWLRDNEDAYCCGDYDAVGDWTECPKDTVIKQELEDE